MLSEWLPEVDEVCSWDREDVMLVQSEGFAGVFCCDSIILLCLYIMVVCSLYV